VGTLTVWKFSTALGAERAESILEQLQKQELITVHDAAVVSWPEEAKKPKTRQLKNLTSAGAFGGAKPSGPSPGCSAMYGLPSSDPREGNAPMASVAANRSCISCCVGGKNKLLYRWPSCSSPASSTTPTPSSF